MSIVKNKLFVWNLSWNMRWKHLIETFSEFWEVKFATVVLDKETKRSKWFWFVEFEDEESAAKAMEEMNWKEVEWREIRIDFAVDNRESE